MKRRHATASVSPYLVAAVGFTNHWLYENGVLCYCNGSRLRILDLHRSASHEIVVDLSALLEGALAPFRVRQKFKRKLLYYSHNIISCLYAQTSTDQAGCRNWLLVFNPQAGRIITIHELSSTSGLFVRNNDRFLYYGTTMGPDDGGANLWTITGFNMATGTWLPQPLNIPHMIGTEIGSNVCFEIFDGYFYILSSQRSLDVEEVDWLSYYSCFRFPLLHWGFADLEEARDRQLWRRDNTAGIMDDRWTFLRMFQDEATGQLKAVESRKEWRLGCITPRRTYYTTAISFANAIKVNAAPAAQPAPAAKTQQGGGLRRPPRDPHMVHPGDDNATLSVTLTKCPIRAYHPACQTFIDLVDDSTSFDPADQRLRLRGGTRRLWTPGERAAQQQPPTPPTPTTEAEQDQDQDHDTLLHQINTLYKSETGLFWPPEQDPISPNPALTDLYQVLNPPGYVGSPHGSWDERSMVYTTGGSGGGGAGGGAGGGLKALVFVSWDPAIYLAGTPAYPGGGLGLGGRGGGAAAAANGSHRQAGGDEGKGKGKGKEKGGPTSQPVTSAAAACPSGGSQRVEGHLGGTSSGGVNTVPWRTFEPAKFREIKRGYHFAR